MHDDLTQGRPIWSPPQLSKWILLPIERNVQSEFIEQYLGGDSKAEGSTWNQTAYNAFALSSADGLAVPGAPVTGGTEMILTGKGFVSGGSSGGSSSSSVATIRLACARGVVDVLEHADAQLKRSVFVVDAEDGSGWIHEWLRGRE